MLFDRKTIRWKLFTYYFLLFAIFTLSIILYQNKRETHFKIAQLETTLNEYTNLTNRYIEYHSLAKEKTFSKLDSLKNIISSDKIRITVVNFEGNILYDNIVADYGKMENHKNRPEIQKALFSEFGENIRHSATTNQEYLYYAKSYKTYVIRAAIVYDNSIAAFLKPDRVFIPFFIFLFLVFGFLLSYIANHIGDSITKLKDFAVKIRRNESINTDDDIQFSNDELGFISQEIIQLYQRLGKTKTELVLEKEKLISHLFVLKEGIAFFSSDKKPILNNSHFIFYINIISEETTISVEKIFASEEFREVNDFIDKTIAEKLTVQNQELPRMEHSVQKDGYHFNIQCIVFPDKSFEILISDQTQQMRRSIMKQQITSNISHELKTPISSVKGYLETVLNNPELELSKQHYFIEKAYNQSERLTQLVNDIALLNKIEEYSELYSREKVPVRKVINEAVESFSDQIKQKSIEVECVIEENVIVNANHSLIFSIFRNLMENSVNYGGDNIIISITKYHEDNAFHYFAFADNGPGVKEEHLSRLFERFYRVDSGRSRKEGGTGLGLAIVKNAVISFKGEISARKRKGGGLEFLFSLPK
ncbi:MAG: two-component sensor histidine kinase [Mariniphaga sp.]|nr:two-component sensor histidine kinase [Mariniphaga sp.]